MAKAPKFFAHEQMMEAWEKAGRVRRDELSIKNLILDELHLQARNDGLDAKHVSDLERVLLDGYRLAPVVVFEIGKKLYLGDGFHRTDAHKRHKLPSVNAVVVEGATMQEAVEYATCCNMANTSKGMTAQDKKKAVMMLLVNGWMSRSAKDIGRHAGVSGGAVTRWRAEYCESSGISPPINVVTKSGHSRVAKSKSGAGRPAQKESIASVAASGSICNYLSSRGVWLESAAGSVQGLVGGRCRGFALTFIPEDLRAMRAMTSSPHVVSAVGRAVLLGEHYGLSRKVVLVYEPIACHAALVSLARRLGVEFMTLDQFVEIAKADEGDGSGVDTNKTPRPQAPLSGRASA